MSVERNVSRPGRGQEPRTPPSSGKDLSQFVFVDGDFIVVDRKGLNELYRRRQNDKTHARLKACAELMARLGDAGAERRARRRLQCEMRIWDRAGNPPVRIRATPPDASRRKRGASEPQITITRLSKPVVPLPRYSGVLIDRRGRRGVFVDFEYDGAQRNRFGVARRRVEYQFKDGHAELVGGRIAFRSRLGITVDEVLAAVEQAEIANRAARKNGKIGINVIVQCAADLDQAGRVRSMELLAEEFDRRGLPYVMTLHAPSPGSDQRNYHIHVWYTTRPMERVGTYEWTIGQQLRTDCDGPDALYELRRSWAEICTRVSHERGDRLRYTHLSNAARGMPNRPLGRLKPRQVKNWRAGTIETAVTSMQETIDRNENLTAQIERNRYAAEAANIDRMLREAVGTDARVDGRHQTKSDANDVGPRHGDSIGHAGALNYQGSAQQVMSTPALGQSVGAQPIPLASVTGATGENTTSDGQAATIRAVLLAPTGKPPPRLFETTAKPPAATVSPPKTWRAIVKFDPLPIATAPRVTFLPLSKRTATKNFQLTAGQTPRIALFQTTYASPVTHLPPCPQDPHPRPTFQSPSVATPRRFTIVPAPRKPVTLVATTIATSPAFPSTIKERRASTLPSMDSRPIRTLRLAAISKPVIALAETDTRIARSFVAWQRSAKRQIDCEGLDRLASGDLERREASNRVRFSDLSLRLAIHGVSLARVGERIAHARPADGDEAALVDRASTLLAGYDPADGLKARQRVAWLTRLYCDRENGEAVAVPSSLVGHFGFGPKVLGYPVDEPGAETQPATGKENPRRVLPPAGAADSDGGGVELVPESGAGDVQADSDDRRDAAVAPVPSSGSIVARLDAIFAAMERTGQKRLVRQVAGKLTLPDDILTDGGLDRSAIDSEPAQKSLSRHFDRQIDEISIFAEHLAAEPRHIRRTLDGWMISARAGEGIVRPFNDWKSDAFVQKALGGLSALRSTERGNAEFERRLAAFVNSLVPLHETRLRSQDASHETRDKSAGERTSTYSQSPEPYRRPGPDTIPRPPIGQVLPDRDGSR